MSAGLLAEPAADRVPAELEPRLYAFAIDRVLGWGLPLALGWVLGATGQGWGVVLGSVLGLGLVLLLASAALLSARGLTPGLAATGLRVVDARTGRPPSLAAALRRQGVLALAGLPTFGLGLATLSWTAATDPGGSRRGWHDQVAGTLVVDVRPAPAVEAPREQPQPIVNLTALRLSPGAPATPTAPGTGAGTPAAGNPAVAGAAQPVAPAAAPAVVPAAATTPPAAAPDPATQPTPAATPAAAAERRPGRRRAGVPVPATQVASGPVDQAGPAAPATTAPAGPPGAGTRWRVRLDTGEELPVEGLVLLGRGPQARPGESVAQLVPLRSADMSVSKTHAQVQPVEDGSLVAMDRGSTNGSVVIRRGVPRHLTPGRPMTLLEGDVLRLGDRALEVLRAD